MIFFSVAKKHNVALFFIVSLPLIETFKLNHYGK